MADVTMPRLSDTMEEGTIATWLKKPGEQVSKGEVIAQIETDKATMDLTAFEAGTLQEILAPEGTTVAIGQPVARLGNGKPEASSPAATPETAAAPPEAAAATPDATAAAPEVTAATPEAAAATPETAAARPEGAAARPEAARAQPATPEAGPDSARTNAEVDVNPDVGDGGLLLGAAGKGGGEGEAPSQPPGAESTDSVQPKTRQSRENVAEAPDPSSTSAEHQPAAPASDSEHQPAAPASDADATPSTTTTAGADTDGQADGKVRASPMARHIAAEHGLELSTISGTGPHGRVIRSDVEAALTAGPQGAADASAPAATAAAEDSAEDAGGAAADAENKAAAGGVARGADDKATAPGQNADDHERVPLSQMRRTIARRMAESTRTVPHFFLTTTVDATDLVSLRQQILDQTAGEGTTIKITFNDMIVKAAALAIRKVPEVNVSFADDSLIRHKRVHIGVAVATERGLIVPVLRDVDQKSLGQIARETRDLAERANAGKLQPTDYTGGTFTISNLGMFGVEQFNAVINMPEAAILAVGAIAREPAEHAGEVVLRQRLKLTLSVDHRALDGAIGARYLQALKQLLEKPMLLLV